MTDEKKLECAICLSPFTDAVVLLCGHSYCKICIQTQLKIKDQCSLCKEKTRGYLIPNYILRGNNVPKEDEKETNDVILQKDNKSKEYESKSNVIANIIIVICIFILLAMNCRIISRTSHNSTFYIYHN
jgi:hypothetical protein